uniref:Uncharacterized protein n=1 Tax=Arundo donax TaxID=35708 RepID=A0A0A9FAP4_ARUDO
MILFKQYHWFGMSYLPGTFCVHVKNKVKIRYAKFVQFQSLIPNND